MHLFNLLVVHLEDLERCAVNAALLVLRTLAGCNNPCGRTSRRGGVVTMANTALAERHLSKALLSEDVVVFPKDSLRKYLIGPGLHRVRIESGALLAECRPMKRVEAEADKSVIQLVSVFLVRFGDRYLTYKRTKRLPESRLHGYYSIAFGGHLNPDDVRPLLDIFVPELGLPLITRELSEEVKLAPDSQPSLHYCGLLYDDSREVSKQHLGLVYEVELRSGAYEIGERGFLIHPKFETIDEIKARLDQFENWSVLLVHDLCA
jgi:predicted NUDIX family phosphoesterase